MADGEKEGGKDQKAKEGDDMGIPTVAGAVVKAAGEVVTPALREKLLGPAFEQLGGYLGEATKDWIASKRAAKHAKNLKAHMDAVEGVRIKRDAEDVLSSPEFAEWTAGAMEVDETLDPDLAEFWRAALVAIADGQPIRVRLLHVVKKMDAVDAVFLAAGRVRGHHFLPPPDFGHSHVRKIEDLGIIETFWNSAIPRWHINATIIVFSLCMISYVLANITILAHENSLSSYTRTVLSIVKDNGLTILLMTFLPLLMFSMVPMSRTIKMGRRLTPLGRALMTLKNVVGAPRKIDGRPKTEEAQGLNSPDA